MTSSTGFERDVRLPSDTAEAQRLQLRILAELTAHGYSEKICFGIKLALEEALVNAIKHGNQMDPDKRVFVAYCVSTDRFEIRITDEGEGFNPEEVPDPTAIENLERPCGRGLLLMRGFMTEVEYHPPGNSVSMAKVRDAAAAS